ncbi:XylR family transcriptional regulator [Gayadomonas joobiniege]|uniref:XylR family transcriptional regulator n=1 Tax=Gayadomonas joobiniege TaxID=1234606 RepID=UPI000381DF87|nr:DNA-binding transcriptional regulator [Gayadomonas joobiniege]
MQNVKKVAVLFNANKGYDRKIIKGISAYMREVSNWHICIEDDFVTRLDNLVSWVGDGIIADFDDPEVATFIKQKSLPCVAVGGSYRDPEHYPKQIPYVATNNQKISELGAKHLLNLGFKTFAFFTGFVGEHSRWAAEREVSFCQFLNQNGIQDKDIFIYRSSEPNRDRVLTINLLARWLVSLPKPVAVMAPCDMRAWQVYEACHQTGCKVPTDVSILGVDGDELILDITGNQLSTVMQGSEHMGYLAAKLLDGMLTGSKTEPSIHIIDPIGVQASKSTDIEVVQDNIVRDAIAYIKENVRKGIKVVHVLEYLQVSRSNLDKRFKREIGSTVHDVIFNAQLELVCEYLLNSKLTLAEIAKILGFKSSQYMIMVFKKTFNMTPSEYRKRNLV